MDNSITRINQGSYSIRKTGESVRDLKGKMGDKKTTALEVSADNFEISVMSENKEVGLQVAEKKTLPEKQAAPSTDVIKYSSLDKEDKARYKDTIMDLNKKARLFKKEDGRLKRAAPFDLKQALDRGEENVFVVTAVADEDRSKNSHAFSRSQTVGISNYRDFNLTSDTTTGSYKDVHYTSSPIRSWDDLDFVDPDEKGVPGTAFLPESGSRVRVSSKWESSWQTKTHHNQGVFRETTTDTRAGGFYSVSKGAV